MSPADLLIPTHRHLLGGLSRWLTRAEDELDADTLSALPAARLAPDMYPLATQVRFACVQALEGVYRLRGEPFPDSVTAMLDEGRAAGDRPGTIAACKGRIAETLAFLDGVDQADLAMPADAPIAHALPNGMVFDLTADRFARDWNLSQFYFHVMIAYAILRQAGVALGKRDYVAHMLDHMRMRAPATG